MIKKAPVDQTGNKKIIVNCAVKTDLDVIVKNNILQLMTHDSTLQLQYNELKVWDAAGTDLVASMVPTGNKTYAIIVEATGAQYPVTIDPLLSATPTWRTTYNNNWYFGQAAASAGDVNGDGFGDIVVGAWSYGSQQEGGIFVFYGSAGGMNGSWSTMDAYGSQLGFSVASAGDVNGDGFDDVIAGSPGNPSNQCWGQARIYYGIASGMNSSNYWVVDGDHVNFTYFGYDVASAGDINKDGYDDVIVGAPQYDRTPAQGGNLPNAGKLCVYYGSASGPGTTPNWTAIGTAAPEHLGTQVASADVNGDGYTDILATSPGYNNSGNAFTGRAHVFLNSASGLHTSPDWTVVGPQTGTKFGNAMAPAGDVNGDGFDDMIISSVLYNSGQGIVYVYYGSATGLAASPGWIKTGATADARYGRSLGPAGDVDNDGFGDVIVGQLGNNPSIAGFAKIYCGSATGLSTTANWMASETTPTFISYATAATGVGDVDGDGNVDILVSAAHNAFGAAFIYQHPIIILPLHLLSFAYRCRGIDVQLMWRTTEEVNFNKYIIEKSTNGNDWQFAGSENATGTPTAITNYNYFVPVPTIATFYRLKMVDIDGKYTYSQELAVKNTCGEQSNFTWIAAPNPVRSSGTLQLNLNNYINSNEPLKVQLTDMLGLPRLLTTLTVPAQATYYSTAVKLPALAPGNYALTIRNKDITDSKRVTIIN